MNSKKARGKICISATGDSLDSLVDPRFGRCQYFLIVDVESNDFKALSNSGISAGHGAGISAAQIIVDEGVSAILTGNIGPNAFMVLGQSGIKIYTGLFDKTCDQALEMFKNGELKETQAPTGPGHGAGMGMGSGPGGPPSGAGPGAGQGQGLGLGRRRSQ